MRKKILVVDDQEEVLFFVKEGLRSFLEIEADTASSGEEALGMLKMNDYSLVITDENMPGINGSTLARIIKSEISPAMPVLLLSGEILSEHNEMTKVFDNFFVMLKPVKMEAFFSEIAGLVAGAKTRPAI